MDGEVKAIIEAINAEDKRQNHRLDVIEEEIKSIREFATSIKELTTEIKYMREDIQKQGARIEKLENAPVETMKGIKATTISSIVSAVVGAVIGAIITKFSIGG